MAITLTHTVGNTTTTVTFEDGGMAMDWVDEFSWSPVAQTKTYTTTGALLIEEGTRQAGRPITLEGRIDTAWCPRSMVDQLRAWAATPGIVLSLTIRGVTRNVTFDHEGGNALKGFPVLFYADGSIADDDNYVPSIKLLEL